MMSLRLHSALVRGARDRRSGFTLIELVLAAGLMTLLMVAVFGLIEGSLNLWRKSETRRNLGEQASVVSELLARDLRSLESGERGDLLVEWASFDTDGDGLKETHWPRLRLVRRASAAEIARMQAGSEDPAEASGALIEVAWVIRSMDLKDPDARAEGLIYRGAQPVPEVREDSLFHSNFISPGGAPDTARLDEVTAGLLWFQPLFATQTSIVHDGWVLGPNLADAATSWDSWNSERPDPNQHTWNEPGTGMPRVKDQALLPRRVRLEFEFERAIDRRRRTHTLARMELDDATFEVDDGRLCPPEGTFIKLDGEWMELRGVRGDRVTVKRAQRGTQAMIHDAKALVHWGLTLVREVSVELYREDWNF
ncbi:MAG: prepilin-type N-terminal cleavage/methylation domain-containing protein [bacterium]|jgi:hypothetical protein|nr:hypothetical protein [Planctomycetota bacterium]HIL51941.1 hypothetical protein [Planctomycetota bacterium]